LYSNSNIFILDKDRCTVDSLWKISLLYFLQRILNATAGEFEDFSIHLWNICLLIYRLLKEKIETLILLNYISIRIIISKLRSKKSTVSIWHTLLNHFICQGANSYLHEIAELLLFCQNWHSSRHSYVLAQCEYKVALLSKQERVDGRKNTLFLEQ
jgi:hypothetical protein